MFNLLFAGAIIAGTASATSPALPLAQYGSAQRAAEVCPQNATALRDTGVTVSCRCTADLTSDGAGSVWGTDVYTDDSSICRAARHSGLIGSRGGAITFTVMAGRPAYQGSLRNGVDSSDYGDWSGSFLFSDNSGYGPATQAPGLPVSPPRQSVAICPQNAVNLRDARYDMACSCPARANPQDGGNVWGSNAYTDDSDICGAAIHAGVITARGGIIRIADAPGQSRYRGSVRNGVRANDYGDWPRSFRISRP